MENFVDQKLLAASVNNSKGNVPAFLTKLWKIVEDPQYDELISWNENGTSIRIHKQVEFSQEILPKFYKHNNFSSFVRQVNMYGFRKIVDVASGAKSNDSGDWEFYHACFQRSQPCNIALMKRKVQLKDEAKYNNSTLGNLLQDVEMLKTQHDMVDEKLKQTLTENERLWGEVFDLRERHASQQSMIVKLLQFFLQIVMNKSERPRKRKFTGMEDIPENVFFQKRALHIPDGKKTRVIQYDSPSIAEISGAVDPSLVTATHGKTSISPVSVPQERVNNVPSVSSQVHTTRDYTIKNGNGIEFFNATPSNSMSYTTNTANENSSEKSLPTSPFIFPEVYKPAGEVSIDLSACISTESEGEVIPAQFPIKSSSTLLTPDMIGTKSSSTLLTPDMIGTKSSSTLLTPDTIAVIKKSPNDSQQLSTPIVNMPSLLTRQTSFRDREELSANVENISKSIDMLQDMLSKQEINLDIKHLGSLDVPLGTTNMQDLIKLIRQQTGEEEEEDESTVDIETISPHEEAPITQDKVVPYSPCFSPSNLLGSEFETVNVEDDNSSSFFSSVLQVENDKANN